MARQVTAYCDIYRNEKIIAENTTLIGSPAIVDSGADDEECWEAIIKKWVKHIKIRNAEECWVSYYYEQIEEDVLELGFYEPTYNTLIVEHYVRIRMEEVEDND